MRAQLWAASPEAVDAGESNLWVVGVSRAVGVLTGRFLHLEDLEHEDYAHLPTLTEHAVPVQVTGPPVVESAHNIARTPPVLDHLLVIDEHPPPNRNGRVVFGPDDVQVRIDADHLRLQRRSTGQVIEPQFLSALEPRWHTHPLVRLCHELLRARLAPHLFFSQRRPSSRCARVDVSAPVRRHRPVHPHPHRPHGGPVGPPRW
ncbi:lantibiotic dehydratase [Nocardiopsis sp. LOL_012]|uniref:lantibiotic dehydratase n=1 Tax=Nocardiopsis sp. LOL_012 TaxID=3345409 RepID=UPI003A860B9F